jgi:hypothetical protein
MSNGPISQETLGKQLKLVQDFSKTLSALTTAFTALTEEAADYSEIQKKLGTRLQEASAQFIKITKDTDKYAQRTLNARDKSDEQVASAKKLEAALGTLGAKYNTLTNKELREFNKAQQVYINLSKDEAAAITQSNKVEQELLKTKKEAFKTALAEAKLRIQIDKERRAALEKEVSDLNKAEQAKSKIRKSGIDAVNKRINDEKAANEKLVSSQEKLFARLQRANDQRIKKEQIAADKLAESRKFFGKAFTDAFSPQSIGKAIASVVKFIGVYEILGTLVGKVRDFFVDSVKSFIDFDEKLAKVSAVTNASGSNLKLLEESIRTIAVETRFTANDIAELAISLGKLGVAAKDIPSLLLPVAQAAQATGEDLTKVGESILKTTNQFGLSTEQAASTAAILVGAVNESALSLEDFNVAIGYVGPIANQAGLSLEQTATALGVLSDNGFSASRAGTGLRKILLDLKKPGVELEQTLQQLADRNIGLAEAEELVGKTGAAQLLVILDNIEAVKEASIVEAGYASLLGASAKQMATASGQLDILKSAYNDILITVGEFLVSNELIIRLIGELSEESESLARGFKFLSDRNKELGQSFNDIIEGGLRESKTELEIFSELLKGVDDNELKAVLAEIKRANPKNLEEVSKVLEKIKEGVIIPRPVSALQGISEFIFGPNFRKEALEIQGVLNRLNEPLAAKKTNDIILSNKNAIIKAYGSEIDAILKVTDVSRKKDLAEKKSQGLKLEINELQKNFTKLTYENATATKDQRNAITGQIQGLEALRKKLSEVTNAEKPKGAVTKDPTDKFKSEFQLRLRGFEIERKGIEDSQKDAESAFKFRMDLIEKEYVSKEQKAKEEGNLFEVLSKKRDEQQYLISVFNEELGDYAEKTGDLTIRATSFFDEYSKKFKNSAENTLLLTNATEQFGAAIGNLAQKNSELSLESQLTVIKEANNLYTDASTAINAWTERLKLLNDQYDDSAYGQINLAVAQKKYIDQVKDELDLFTKDYEDLYTALSASIGEDLAKEILRPFANVIDNLSADLNNAILNGTLSDEQLTELKRRLISLKGTIVDGIGEDDIILNIDITPQEVVKAALDTTLEAISNFNDVAFNNTKDRLNAEKDSIKNASDVENEILQAKLENQLITEEEYRAQVEKNRRKEVQAANKIEKQIFDAEQKRERQGALLDYLTALASIIPNLIVKGKEGDPITISLKAAITGALATVSYGAQVRAINQRKFYPTKFAEGGIVSGPSHSEGGVPFTVRGKGGYEMEGGEYIVNKNSTQKYRTLLDQINGKSKSDYKFAAGGIVKDPSVIANRQIELLEAIASSNITMVGKLDKPVRSFVSATDLRSDENARRIQERNSQL